jgi:hypothetical protein
MIRRGIFIAPVVSHDLRQSIFSHVDIFFEEFFFDFVNDVEIDIDFFFFQKNSFVQNAFVHIVPDVIFDFVQRDSFLWINAKQFFEQVDGFVG